MPNAESFREHGGFYDGVLLGVVHVSNELTRRLGSAALLVCRVLDRILAWAFRKLLIKIRAFLAGDRRFLLPDGHWMGIRADRGTSACVSTHMVQHWRWNLGNVRHTNTMQGSRLLRGSWSG